MTETAETIEIENIVGRYEAEEILGIRPRTFARALANDALPRPFLTLLDGTKLWHRTDLENWANDMERYKRAVAEA